MFNGVEFVSSILFPPQATVVEEQVESLVEDKFAIRSLLWLPFDSAAALEGASGASELLLSAVDVVVSPGVELLALWDFCIFTS